MTCVRIGAVGYLNARPLVYGLERHPRFRLRFDVPSECARLLHVRGIRQITIGRDNRAERSIQDHLGIIGAIEQRDTERAERLSREHTLGLAAYVEQYGDRFFD